MAKRKPADIHRLLTAGGEQRIALLRLCICAVRMEPMFVFLTQEYRLRPTRAAALALYDIFCTPNALARIAAGELIASTNLPFHLQMRSIRHQVEQPAASENHAAIPVTSPYRNLFDNIARFIDEDPAGNCAWFRDHFNPRHSPAQHLPGGKMSAAQLHFANYVWKPRVRPRLVAAGFWQIAVIE